MPVLRALANTISLSSRCKKNGTYPIHAAAASQKIDPLLFILECGVDVNKPTDFMHNAPLHTAIYHDNREGAQELIHHGADIHQKNLKKDSPIILAVRKSNLPMVDFLIKNKAHLEDLDAHQNSALHLAAENGDYQTFKTLCKAFKKAKIPLPINQPNRKGNTVLHAAIVGRNSKIIQKVKNLGADQFIANYDGVTPFFSLNPKAQKNYNPLENAILTRKTQLALKLIRTNNSYLNTFTPEGYTPLHLAVLHNNTQIIEALIKKGMSTEILTKDGTMTPLHLASSKEKVEAMRTLLLNGANPNSKVTHTENTALHLAVRKNSKRAVKLLLQKKGDLNQKNKLGTTPIMTAIFCKNVEMIAFLARNKPDLKALNLNDNNLIHLAVITHDIKL